MITLRSILSEIDDTNNMPNQDLVDRMAKSKGYIHQTYRGDTHDGRIFNYTRKERREYGIFTTPIKEVAAVYAGDRTKGEPRRFYVKASNILDLTKDTLENMKWVQSWGEGFDDWIDRQSGDKIDAWYALEGGRMFDYEGDWSSYRWMDIQRTADHQGYDAIILPDHDSKAGIFPSFVVFDEKNIKLADTATYDDKDQLIPLEQRFNYSSNDIRY
jgi:hypothetical protein